MKRVISILFSAVLSVAAVIPVCGARESGKILKIDFKSEICEQENNSFSFSSMSFASLMNGGGSMSLLRMIRTIDYAATDPSVSMIYMTPDNLSAGMAQMEEIRAALKRFRESGKTIVSYCDNFSNLNYYMASVADKVVLNPASENYMLGLATQQMFLKDALDMLGVEVQLIRHGKYKSAGEMFTRSDFSPENYEQNRVMVNSLWDGICEEVCSSRGIETDDFKAMVANLELSDAGSFLEHGLVDELWYRDQLEDYLCEFSSVPLLKMVGFVPLKRYADKVDKMLRKQNRKVKDAVAVVYADGEIVVSEGGSSLSSGNSIVGRNLAETLAKVRQDDNIKAVVFRVNSPGGSVMASEVIKREMDLLKAVKPVISSYGDYAASGGYWISACSDFIFTDRTTLTGSIGCFSLVPNIGGALKKVARVNFATVGTSAHSDMMTGMRSLDQSEINYLQAEVENIYDRFTSIVSEGRKLDKDRVDEIGQGRVWAGADAVGLGLADCIGGLSAAIAYAAGAAGLEQFNVTEYPEVKPFSFMSLFADDEPVDETITSETASAFQSVIRNTFPFASALRKANSPVMMARMQYSYSFN